MFQSEACGAIASLDDVERLTGPQLAALFRELTGQAVKKFRDLKTARDKVRPWLEKALTPPAERNRKRKPFIYPAKGEVRRHMPGTKRGALIEMLSRPGGATFEECQEAAGWQGKHKITYENIYLLHSWLGYGLMEDQQGRIRLFTDQKENEQVERQRADLGDYSYRLHLGHGVRRGAVGDEGGPGVAARKNRQPSHGGPGVLDDVARDRDGSGHRRAERLSAALKAEVGQGCKVKATRDEGVFLVVPDSRLKFLMEAVGEEEAEALLSRAFNRYDRLICALLDGNKVVVVNRNGITEDFES